MNENMHIGFGSGADDFMVMNRATVDKLWDLGSDAYTLYGFYFKTAKWQKTNQIKAVDTYTMSCLKWGKDRLRGAKNGLKTNGLITVLQAKKRGVIDGWYIRVEYLVPEKKVPVSGHEIIEVADTENKLSVDDLIDGLKSFSPEEIYARIPQDLIKSSGVLFPEDSKTTHWSEVANALILLTKCLNTLSKKNKQKEKEDATVSFKTFRPIAGSCKATNRNGSRCSRKKIGFEIDGEAYCTQHGQSKLNDYGSRGIKTEETITKDSLPPKESLEAEAELLDYWIQNVREVVLSKRNHKLTLPTKSDSNLRLVNALINKIKIDDIRREGIAEPKELVKFIFDNELSRWIDVDPWGNQQQPLDLLEFELLTRPHLALKKISQPDKRKTTQSVTSDLLAKVKDADMKIDRANSLGADDFRTEMIKLTKEEAAYLILTKKLNASWYDFFFGGDNNPNVETFKSMAEATGIAPATGKKNDILDCEVIEGVLRQ